MATFIHTRKSKFELVAKDGIYMRQHNADGTTLNWGLYYAKRNGFDADHYSPNWQVGDNLCLILLSDRTVEKHIKIDKIEHL